MRRTQVFLAVLAAVLAVNFAVEEVAGLDGEGGSPVQLAPAGSWPAQVGEGKKAKTVTVNVVKKVSVPKPTVKELVPTKKAAALKKFKKETGHSPKSASEKKAVKKIAKRKAASALNKMDRNKDALRIARRKEKRYNRTIKRKERMVQKVMRNEEYLAAKDRRKLERKLAKKNKVLKIRAKRAKKSLAKAERKKFKADHADTLDNRLQAQVAKNTLKAKLWRAKDDKAHTADLRAHAIVHKYNAAKKKAKEDIKESRNVLEHMEEHEAEAAVVNKEAKIKVEFEDEDAAKVRVMLKKLVAKRNAIDKFTKNLDKKAKRDFKAAKAGVGKSKVDHANAKKKYDKYTKLAGAAEGKAVKSRKQKAQANREVVAALKMGKDATAIKAAESHTYLKKRLGKEEAIRDKEDTKAKGENKLMGAAMVELAKSLKLDTLSRKESNRVVQDRMTMAAQVKKIRFLKSEVKTHERAAASAKKRAKAALLKVKKMRIDANLKNQQAKAKLRLIDTIEMKIAKQKMKGADRAFKISKYKRKLSEARMDKSMKKEKEMAVLAKKLNDKKQDSKMKLVARVTKAKRSKKKQAKAVEKLTAREFKDKKRIERAQANILKLKKLSMKAKLAYKKKVRAAAAKPATPKGKVKGKKKKGKKLLKGKKKKGKEESLAESNSISSIEAAMKKEFGVTPIV